MNTSAKEQVLEILKQSRCHHIMKCTHSGHLDAVKADELFTAALEAKEREVEVEQGRWQEAIYRLLTNRVPINIDGGGCDSGDPLDLTLTEIGQALIHVAEERDALKAELARRIVFTEEWMANPNKTKPETFEDWSKWMDGWNELKRLTITQEQEIRALKAEVERLRAYADLTQTLLMGERDEARRLLGEARSYLREVRECRLFHEDSMDMVSYLPEQIDAFLANPALARVLGEVGK